MNLVALPALSDNLIWMLHDGREALIVDPGDAAPVLETLRHRALRLSGILVTHHHPDHIGGVSGLLPHLQGPIWSSGLGNLPFATIGLAHGDHQAWAGMDIHTLHTPGHTLDHACFVVHQGAEGYLFSGDTLFHGGCGRLFEGTASQMHASLRMLASLSGELWLCCAHEYSVNNLRFAQAVEPDNARVARTLAACMQKRVQGLNTLPSRLSLEFEVNPFMRCEHDAVQRSAQQHGAMTTQPEAVFAALRQWKNQF